MKVDYLGLQETLGGFIALVNYVYNGKVNTISFNPFEHSMSDHDKIRYKLDVNNYFNKKRR